MFTDSDGSIPIEEREGVDERLGELSAWMLELNYALFFFFDSGGLFE